MEAHEYSQDDLLIPIGDSQAPVRPDQKIPGNIGFIRLSGNEVMRLAVIALSDITNGMKAFHLRWSRWRRRHQAISRWYHQIARMRAGQESRNARVFAKTTTKRDQARGRRVHTEARAA
jgi:hypothetical protein